MMQQNSEAQVYANEPTESGLDQELRPAKAHNSLARIGKRENVKPC